MTKQDQSIHPEDRRNLILFLILAVGLYFLFDHYVMKPRVEAMKQAKQATLAQNGTLPAPDAVPGATHDAAGVERPRELVLTETTRIAVDTPSLQGSLSLTGARLDDLRLKKFFSTLEKTENVTLLSPAGTKHARYYESGWIPDDRTLALPDAKTVWRIGAGGDKLSPGNPVLLYWDNGQGLLFEKKFEVDDTYMFTVTQSVTNRTGRPVTLHPYTLLSQRGLPEGYVGASIMHEGLIGYIGDDLIEDTYKKMGKEPERRMSATNGWIGITEKYWLTAVVPAQGGDTAYRFLKAETKNDKEPRYQVDTLGAPVTIAPDARQSIETRLFSGAKELDTLQGYEDKIGIRHFDLAVDFGLFYFLTKPFFHILNFINQHVGNFGIAILIFTVLLRLAIFPLANTSFKSFAKLKQVSPQMAELREKHGNDKAKLQEEIVKLYQREKVNPMAGCLPILIQIPIFFALYKVLYVSIEMRHQPFYGWIDDLSAPDPTNVFNLFGLLPFDPPGFLHVGAWSCFMLVAMLIQRRLNPPPQDPVQAQMFLLLPFFVTFIMAKFAAGLVIYWTFSNFLSVIQQYVIMRRMGVEVYLFKKAPGEKKLEEEVAKGPAVHPATAMVEHEIEEALFGDDAKPVSLPKPKKKPGKKTSGKKQKSGGKATSKGGKGPKTRIS